MAKCFGNQRMMFRRMVSGFSLVEIMVAMVIGLLTTIVIMQSFAAFEGQKRTTTTGSDTQENGLIAMQAIESDARNAGYGLLTPNGLACTSMTYYESGVTGTSGVAPVQVSDGGAAGASDTLNFTYATSPLAGTPFALDSDVMTPAQIDFFPQQMTEDRDLYLLASPITSPGIGATEIPCSRLAYASAVASPVKIYNSPNVANYFPVGGYVINHGYFIVIGSGLNGAAGFMRAQYRVDASNDLVMDDVSHFGAVAPTSTKLASNIVNLQVQYGIAPVNQSQGATSPSVDCWTDASGTACNASSNWAAPNAADIMRIKAIRIAVVARSALMEKPSTPGGACDATTAAPISWPGGPAIDLSANANWRCHRYRVYQTVIPLRNVIWANI